MEARLEEIARLLAVLVARDRPLQDAIGEMAAFGIPQARIAGLVDRSQGYVNVAVERTRKKRSGSRGTRTGEG